MDEYLKTHPAYKYAVDVVSGSVVSNKEIMLVCQKFLNEIDNGSNTYWFDSKLLKKITNLFALINMGDGLNQGQPVSKTLVGFQWFFIANTLCWKLESDHSKRRYEKSLMLISRKNGKVSPFKNWGKSGKTCLKYRRFRGNLVDYERLPNTVTHSR